MASYLGQIEILQSSCNISTVQDGRGAIFSWVPNEDIKEFTLLFFQVAKVRGNHYHPEFTEYFIVVDGAVVLVTQDQETGESLNTIAGAGFCFRTPPGVPHAVHAIEPSHCISLLTKPWNDCENPIIREDLIKYDSNYIDFINKNKES